MSIVDDPAIAPLQLGMDGHLAPAMGDAHDLVVGGDPDALADHPPVGILEACGLRFGAEIGTDCLG